MASEADKDTANRALRVFVSYSRDDADFADQLVPALGVSGFNTSIDTHAIVGGEDWQKRLHDLILASDTVVFVLSPSSAKSDKCAWEVNEARRQGKRLIPVVCREVDDNVVPANLKQLNYIHFVAGRAAPRGGFGVGLAALVDALRVDVAWIREHTRIGEMAERWNQRDRPDELLLRGGELAETLRWRAARPPDAPALTAVMLDFINVSEAAETARADAERQRLDAYEQAVSAREAAAQQLSRRTVLGGAGLAALAMVATGASYWAYRNQVELQRAKEREANDRTTKEANRTDIRGQLMAFATEPDAKAYDEPWAQASNSFYLQTLLAELENRELSLFDALSRAAARVRTAKDRMKQRPYLTTDLNGDVFLWSMPPTRRVRALVVGVDRVGKNDKKGYKNVPNDIQALRKLFGDAGIPVDTMLNPSRTEFEAKLEGLQQSGGRSGSNWEPKNGLLHQIGLSAEEEPDSRDSDNIAPNRLSFLVYVGLGFRIDAESYLPVGIGAKESFTRLSDKRKLSLDGIVEETGAIRLADIRRILRKNSAASVAILDTAFENLTYAVLPDTSSDKSWDVR